MDDTDDTSCDVRLIFVLLDAVSLRKLSVAV